MKHAGTVRENIMSTRGIGRESGPREGWTSFCLYHGGIRWGDFWEEREIFHAQ